jgi:hypothetical protein
VKNIYVLISILAICFLLFAPTIAAQQPADQCQANGCWYWWGQTIQHPSGAWIVYVKSVNWASAQGLLTGTAGQRFQIDLVAYCCMQPHRLEVSGVIGGFVTVVDHTPRYWRPDQN